MYIHFLSELCFMSFLRALKHNLAVELVEGIPEATTMLSHKDLTLGKLRVKKEIWSVGILRRTNFDLSTSVLKKTSASSKMPTFHHTE